MEKLVPDDGQVVSIQGYQFVVENPRVVSDDKGQSVLRFQGKAMDSTLIGTGYDGGTYGHILGYRTY